LSRVKIRGPYIGKYSLPGGDISCCHLGEKIETWEEKKGENVREEGRKRGKKK
jgi:hypothetical protein